MKKILLASLLALTVISVDVMAKGGNKPEGATERKEKGERKGPTFKDGCLVIDSNMRKGPMADVVHADDNEDGCITEEELKKYMEDNKPDEAMPPRGARPEGMPPKA